MEDELASESGEDHELDSITTYSYHHLKHNRKKSEHWKDHIRSGTNFNFLDEDGIPSPSLLRKKTLVRELDDPDFESQPSAMDRD